MKILDLKEYQKEIKELIDRTARKANLINGDVEPIYDGIADEEGYLGSKLKVAWVLKEPYDDFNANGDPEGGGFSLPWDCFYKTDAWRNPVWQRIAYVMYGFRNALCWDDMDWISENHDMIHVIRDIAWINISKMPARTTSGIPDIKAKYDTIWRDVVLRQLELYAPDVIIFGNTFECLWCDPQRNRFQQAQQDESVSAECSGDSRWRIDYFRLGDQRLISAYHPGRKDGSYVDVLISALKQAEKELIH